MRQTFVGTGGSITDAQMANNQQIGLVSQKSVNFVGKNSNWQKAGSLNRQGAINAYKLSSVMMRIGVCVSAIFFSIFIAQAQQTAAVGKIVTSVKLVDSKNAPKSIPFFGEKVIVIFYNDPDVKDVNDPLSDALKAKNFSKEKYAGMGIANCKDTWAPNSAIRMMVRKKEKQFPGTLILLDEKLVLAKAWGLGDCDGISVVLVIGKDSKIKFIKKIKTEEESKALIPTVVKIIQDELAK